MSIAADVHVRCDDGPMAGAEFWVTDCPDVVYCVEATDGTRDILNEPGDLPRLDETTHPYRVTGRSPFFLCARGRGTSGLSFIEVRLEHAPADRRLER